MPTHIRIVASVEAVPDNRDAKVVLQASDFAWEVVEEQAEATLIRSNPFGTVYAIMGGWRANITEIETDGTDVPAKVDQDIIAAGRKWLSDALDTYPFNGSEHDRETALNLLPLIDFVTPMPCGLPLMADGEQVGSCIVPQNIEHDHTRSMAAPQNLDFSAMC